MSATTKGWLQTWADVYKGLTPSYQTASGWLDLSSGYLYAQIAMTATSYLAGETNGTAAWNVMKTNELNTDHTFATDPRWAILPRVVGATTPPDTTPPAVPTEVSVH
jgi:hypothetical protein